MIEGLAMTSYCVDEESWRGGCAGDMYMRLRYPTGLTSKEQGGSRSRKV